MTDESAGNDLESSTIFSENSSSGSSYSGSSFWGGGGLTRSKGSRKKSSFWVRLIEAVVAAGILVALGVENFAIVVFFLILIWGL